MPGKKTGLSASRCFIKGSNSLTLSQNPSQGGSARVSESACALLAGLTVENVALTVEKVTPRVEKVTTAAEVVWPCGRTKIAASDAGEGSRSPS